MTTTNLYQFAGELASTAGIPKLLADIDTSHCQHLRIAGYSDVMSNASVTLILSIEDDRQGYGPLFTTVLEPGTSFTEVSVLPGLRLKFTAISSQSASLGLLIVGWE